MRDDVVPVVLGLVEVAFDDAVAHRDPKASSFATFLAWEPPLLMVGLEPLRLVEIPAVLSGGPKD